MVAIGVPPRNGIVLPHSNMNTANVATIDLSMTRPKAIYCRAFNSAVNVFMSILDLAMLTTLPNSIRTFKHYHRQVERVERCS